MAADENVDFGYAAAFDDNRLDSEVQNAHNALLTYT